MVQLGREGGLKTFEQVHQIWNCLSFQIIVILMFIDWADKDTRVTQDFLLSKQ